MAANFNDCKSCSRENDNKAFSCPEKMEDGRLFTNWRPRSSTQYYNMVTNNMPDSYSYRQYMTQNAETLIKQNAAEAYMRAACGPCDNDYNAGHMLPETDEQVCDSRKCTFRTTDPFGLGRSRMYDQNMDDSAKKAFLEAKKREQEWFRNSAECCGTNLEELQYYPIDGRVSQEYSRHAIPGGGTFMTGGSRLSTQGFE
jgi:hypothetical protein